MKIWLLTSETPLYNPGGIARYVDNFARYLSAAGHEVTVFGRDDTERSQEILPGYTYVSVVPRWDRCGETCDSPRPDDHPAFPYNILDYWGAFSYQMAETVTRQISEQGPPDVIESQEYCALPYYLLQQKLTADGPLRDIPVVVNAHSPDFLIRACNEEPRYQFPHYWTGRLEMACLHAADAIICPSGYLTRQLEEMFGGSIEVSHFPLPWTEPGEPVAIPETVTGKVVYFGRLEVRKGTLKLLQECDRLWDEGLDFQLHLIGSDTRYYPRDCTVGEWLQRKYTRWLEAGKLVIHGQMDHAEVMEEIRSAAFTIIPSTWENWPNTCIEAMSLGKVVVGSTDGGQAEMIGDDESCGFVFSWTDEDGFATAFKKALELDPGQRSLMGENARQRIAGLCSPDVVLPTRLAHFESLKGYPAKERFPFVNRHLRDSRAKADWQDISEAANRVSIIIPHYNLGQYLEAAVDSAVNAEWPDKEIIVIDDGSNEESSQEVLEKLAGQDIPGLRIHRQRNSGLASARNKGAELATGEFLLLLDADDQIEPTFIRKCVDVLRRYDNVHIVYSWERYIEASHDIYPCWNFEFPYLLGHNMTCPISVLYRKSYLTYGPSKPMMAYNFEDFELWINLVKNGCGGVALTEPLSLYRIRENSMWQGSPREQHLYLQDLIAEEHPDLYQRYGAELFCLLNANGSSQKWIKPSANSPFDEYEQWSRRRITNLEKEARKWWERTVETEKKLQQSEEEKHAVWLEKNRLDEALQQQDEGKSPS
ncbi:MAG: glycosyltransferase [Puniceicoccaceae bacterium]